MPIDFKPQIDFQEAKVDFQPEEPRLPAEAPSQPSTTQNLYNAAATGIQGQLTNTLIKAADTGAHKLDEALGGYGNFEGSLLANPNLMGMRLLYNQIMPSPGYTPQSLGEKAVSLAADFADPATFATFEGGGALAQPLLARTGILAKGARLAKLAEVAERGASYGLEGLPSYTKQIFLNKVAQHAVSDPISLGLLSFTHEGANQVVSGQFDPAELAKQTAFGVGGGVLLSPLSAGAGMLLERGKLSRQFEKEEIASKRSAQFSEPATEQQVQAALNQGTEGLTGGEFDSKVASNRDALLKLPEQGEKLQSKLDDLGAEQRQIQEQLGRNIPLDDIGVAQLKTQLDETETKIAKLTQEKQPATPLLDRLVTQGSMNEAQVQRAAERLAALEAKKADLLERQRALTPGVGSTGGIIQPQQAPKLEKLSTSVSKLEKQQAELRTQIENQYRTLENPKEIDAFKLKQERAAAAQKAEAINNHLSLLEQQRSNLLKGIESKEVPLNDLERGKLKTRLEENEKKIVDLNKEFHAVTSDPMYRTMVEMKSTYGDLKIEGKRVFSRSLSPTGHIAEPEAVRYYQSRPDISSYKGGNASHKDISRLAQEIDGSVRGRMQQEIVEPVKKAALDGVQAFSELYGQHAQLAEKIGLKPRSWGDFFSPRQKALRDTLFAAAEGKLSPTAEAELTSDQRAYLKFVRESYDSLLEKINDVRKANNLEPIQKRANYVTHLRQMSNAEVFGIRLGDTDLQLAPRKVLTSESNFKYKARNGDESGNDIYTAFTTYARAATREIHTLDAGNQAKALVPFMKPNTARAVNDWIESAVWGGQDMKDKMVADAGLSTIANLANRFTSHVSGAVLNLSPLTILKHFGQMFVSASASGYRNAAESILGMFSQVPDELLEKSLFLRQRALRGEIDGAIKDLSPTHLYSRAFDYIEGAVSRHTWLTAFKQATRNFNFGTDAAVRYADSLSQMIQPVYSEVWRPAAIRGQLGKTLNPFQTFFFNIVNHALSDQKYLAELNERGVTHQYLRFVASIAAANHVYHMLGLPESYSMGSLDPHAENFMGYNKAEGKFSLHGLSAPGELIPFSSSARFGGTFPAYDLLRYMGTIAFNEDSKKKEEALSELEGLTKPLIFPTAGREIIRLYQGAKALHDGYFQVGQSYVPITDTADKARALFLGPRNSLAVKDFVQMRKRLK